MADLKTNALDSFGEIQKLREEVRGANNLSTQSLGIVRLLSQELRAELRSLHSQISGSSSSTGSAMATTASSVTSSVDGTRQNGTHSLDGRPPPSEPSLVGLSSRVTSRNLASTKTGTGGALATLTSASKSVASKKNTNTGIRTPRPPTTHSTPSTFNVTSPPELSAALLHSPKVQSPSAALNVPRRVRAGRRPPPTPASTTFSSSSSQPPVTISQRLHDLWSSPNTNEDPPLSNTKLKRCGLELYAARLAESSTTSTRRTRNQCHISAFGIPVPEEVIMEHEFEIPLDVLEGLDSNREKGDLRGHSNLWARVRGSVEIGTDWEEGGSDSDSMGGPEDELENALTLYRLGSGRELVQ
uniref:Uncharacterized protein n=1 Tax=Moniliophthora roreri TaxID=221103 RepID=A0A0W0G8V6_MONRR